MAATKRKKPRSAAQKRATAKLVAFNKARRKAPSSKRAYAANPATKPRRRRANAATASRAGRTLRRYRRNPAGMPTSVKQIIARLIKPAVSETVGALALDVTSGYANRYLPATLTTGPARHLVKGAMAVGVGYLASKVSKRGAMAADMARGGLVVVMHDAAKELLGQVAPSLPLAGNDYNGIVSDFAVGDWAPVGIGSQAMNGIYETQNMNGIYETAMSGFDYDNDDF